MNRAPQQAIDFHAEGGLRVDAAKLIARTKGKAPMTQAPRVTGDLKATRAWADAYLEDADEDMKEVAKTFDLKSSGEPESFLGTQFRKVRGKYHLYTEH